VLGYRLCSLHIKGRCRRNVPFVGRGEGNVEGKRTHDAKPSWDPTDGFTSLCRAAAHGCPGLLVVNSPCKARTRPYENHTAARMIGRDRRI
jgi:hypothetical protein